MWNNKCIVDSFLTTPLIYVTSCQIYLYMTHSHIHIRHVWIHLKFCPRMNQKKSFCQNVAIHSSRLFFLYGEYFQRHLLKRRVPTSTPASRSLLLIAVHCLAAKTQIKEKHSVVADRFLSDTISHIGILVSGQG